MMQPPGDNAEKSTKKFKCRSMQEAGTEKPETLELLGEGIYALQTEWICH